MPRPIDKYSNPRDDYFKLSLLYDIGTAGIAKLLRFDDGSINYLGAFLKQNFMYLLIDNIGTGSIRISFNKPTLDISSSKNGAKTLKAGDSLYIEDDVWCVNIYYIENSEVELVLRNN